MMCGKEDAADVLNEKLLADKNGEGSHCASSWLTARGGNNKVNLLIILLILQSPMFIMVATNSATAPETIRPTVGKRVRSQAQWLLGRARPDFQTFGEWS